MHLAYHGTFTETGERSSVISEEDATRLASVMKILASPSRLRLLCALRRGEQTVGSLCDELDFTQAYVSQQLARLREARLLDSRRDGRRVFYSVADRRVLEVMEAMGRAYGVMA